MTNNCVYTITVAADGALTRYRFESGGSGSTSKTGTSCPSGTCALASFTAHYQVKLTVNGGNGVTYSLVSETGDLWWNLLDSTIVSSNGIYGRSGGIGTRISSWNLDGGANTLVATTSSVLVTVSLATSHTLTFNSATQYQVSLDIGATAALSTITNPTIAGDKYWYDSGTTVTVIMNGVWGRAGGAGARLASYSLNGGSSVTVATTGTITPINSLSLAAAQTINSITKTQVQFTMDAGATSALSSLTPPPIAGDNYWYDLGTSVVYVGNGVYGRSSGVGMRIASWWLDSGIPTTVLTAGIFTVATTANSPYTLHTVAVLQYKVTITGTYSISLITPPTIVGDNYWYDSGGPISITMNTVFGRTGGIGTRMTSYSVNGGPSNPVLTNHTILVLSLTDLGAPQSVSTGSTIQYQVSLDSISISASSLVTPPSLPGDKYWYDSGTTVTVQLRGVWNRVANTGIRLVSYSLDGSSSVPVSSSGLVNVIDHVQISSPHSLVATGVIQYFVAVNGGSNITYSINPPIVGDTGWYDTGTSVQVSSGGIFGRAAGTGQRVVSWAVDGGVPTPVSTTGQVSTSTLTVTSPHVVNFNSVTQYQLFLNPGAYSVLNTIVPPTLSGDNYWYDSGSGVTLTLNGVASQGTGSRFHLLSYSVDGAAPVSATGLSAVKVLQLVSIVSPHIVNATVASQFLLQVAGGNGVNISETSPTGDNWYDQGTSLSISTQYTWNQADGQSRTNLKAYSVDGTPHSIRREDSGQFSTSSITMNQAHNVTFVAVTQYYVTFAFQDYAGTSKIVPSELVLNVRDIGPLNVTSEAAWIDNGTVFSISSIRWEGVDVKPVNLPIFYVYQSRTLQVNSLVYSGTITVVDLLGQPISGASGSITLANGTTISGQSRGDGTIRLTLIPLGRFHATVNNLGTSTTVDGDLSSNMNYEAKLPLSYLELGLVALAVIAFALLILYRSSSKNRTYEM
jgi:hypothetical protein